MNTPLNKEQIRAVRISNYIGKIYDCLDEAYEALVDRDYQGFNNEIDAAIEFLQHLKEKRDKAT